MFLQMHKAHKNTKLTRHWRKDITWEQLKEQNMLSLHGSLRSRVQNQQP